MASYHDAYLFKPEQFAQALVPYLAGLQKDVNEGYRRLRASALQLFDRSQRSRYMLTQYGGWDRARLEAELSPERPKGFYEVSFWMVLMLYEQLLSRPHALGLGSHWTALEQFLPRAGWPPEDAARLVRGRKFLEFGQSLPGVALLGPWHYFYPPCPGGQAGWLTVEDARQFKRPLTATGARLQLMLSDMQSGADSVYAAYRGALQMCTAADEAGTGLVMLIGET